jgi:hypothetical protein
LLGASEVSGTVMEVLTGDTVNILPDGEAYDSESKLMKVSLASICAPRVGNERVGRADEQYSHECKERLRVLTVGKPCKVQVHYEREIPLGDKPENRRFRTISTKKPTMFVPPSPAPIVHPTGSVPIYLPPIRAPVMAEALDDSGKETPTGSSASSVSAIATILGFVTLAVWGIIAY